MNIITKGVGGGLCFTVLVKINFEICTVCYHLNEILVPKY